MALLVPDVGEAKLLAYALNKSTPEDMTLKLFKNNYTPVEGSVAGDFTVADFTGYANVSVLGSSWTITTTAGVTEAARAAAAFTSSADQTAQNVYGYYVIGASTGVVLWAERFTDGPYSISINGDQINVTLKITLA